MSRSIHANRSDRQFSQTGFVDWKEIGRKRDIKKSAVRSRTTEDPPDGAMAVEEFPIVVTDASPFLFFPASIKDMRAVLGLLPRGTLDGVKSIQLGAGTRSVNRDAKWHPASDPFLGRKSVEIFPKVYVPLILGHYNISSQSVNLYGIVKSPRKILTRSQLAALELQALGTLVHEVAHHFDRVRRMGQGRPWFAMHSKAERFAHVKTTQWTEELVLPYLRRKHGASALCSIPILIRRALGI
jgi:hypothetical protein